MEGAIFVNGKLGESTHTFDGVLLLVLALKPYFAVRMSGSESLKKRRWAIVVEVDCTNDVGNRIKGGGVRLTKESRSTVAWLQHAFNAETAQII